MPSMEEMKRKAQSAAYTATEKAQEAAAVAGEKAEEFMGYAGVKAESFRGYAGEKAGALLDYAGAKASALVDSAKTGVALLTEKRNLEKSYQALGEWYAANCGDDAPEAVADVIAAIRASEAKIAELKARGEAAEDDAESPAEADEAGETPEEG